MSQYDLEEPLTSTARPGKYYSYGLKVNSDTDFLLTKFNFFLFCDMTTASDSILTIRIIKSFPYRNVKNIILNHIDLKQTTCNQLFKLIIDKINKEGALKPYRGINYDTIKIYTHAHGTKSMNLVINLEHDIDDTVNGSWVLDLSEESGKKLSDYDIGNETELSIFNNDDYLKYKSNPEDKW